MSQKNQTLSGASKLYTLTGQVIEELSEGLSTQNYRVVRLGRNIIFELRMK